MRAVPNTLTAQYHRDTGERKVPIVTKRPVV